MVNFRAPIKFSSFGQSEKLVGTMIALMRFQAYDTMISYCLNIYIPY